jgi:hypothetical protein
MLHLIKKSDLYLVVFCVKCRGSGRDGLGLLVLHVFIWRLGVLYRLFFTVIIQTDGLKPTFYLFLSGRLADLSGLFFLVRSRSGTWAFESAR